MIRRKTIKKLEIYGLKIENNKHIRRTRLHCFYFDNFKHIIFAFLLYFFLTFRPSLSLYSICFLIYNLCVYIINNLVLLKYTIHETQYKSIFIWNVSKMFAWRIILRSMVRVCLLLDRSCFCFWSFFYVCVYKTNRLTFDCTQKCNEYKQMMFRSNASMILSLTLSKLYKYMEASLFTNIHKDSKLLWS